MIKDKLLPVAQLISKITNQFYLAGGTAIMLKYDHRESYDLYFFYGKSFSFKRLGKRSDSSENSTSKISLSLLPGSKSNKEILSLWKKRNY